MLIKVCGEIYKYSAHLFFFFLVSLSPQKMSCQLNIPTSPSLLENNSFTVFKQDGSHQFYCRWTVEEDMLLAKAVADHGPHKWTLVSKLIPGRTAVQCSTRWFGALK